LTMDPAMAEGPGGSEPPSPTGTDGAAHHHKHEAVHGAHPHATPLSDHDHMGHGHARYDHAGMVADFRKRFWVSLVLTVPVLVLSPLI
jgi:Cu2+-exporting ATPase